MIGNGFTTELHPSSRMQLAVFGSLGRIFEIIVMVWKI